MESGIHLEVTCLLCGDVAMLYEDQIDQLDYICSKCGTIMAKSQWRRAKANYYFAEELTRQVFGAIGIRETVPEIRAFEVLCCGPCGDEIKLNYNSNISANGTEIEWQELRGYFAGIQEGE